MRILLQNEQRKEIYEREENNGKNINQMNRLCDIEIPKSCLDERWNEHERGWERG